MNRARRHLAERCGMSAQALGYVLALQAFERERGKLVAGSPFYEPGAMRNIPLMDRMRRSADKAAEHLTDDDWLSIARLGSGS